MSEDELGDKRRTLKSHIHIVLPTYLLKHIIKLAEAHDTSVSYEIEVAVLLRIMNHAE